MKTTDAAEVVVGAFSAMKPAKPSGRMSSLPMEWMDPMSWRLPSGKALAEFALQSGFLAPLILNGPKVNKKVKGARNLDTVSGSARSAAKEVPGQPGTFRSIP
jgi:hypothetical protein